MSQGFERFQELFAQKQNELNIQVRNTQKTKEDETARKQAEARQKQIESDQKAAENKKIFEAAGVVKLFEEIRDKGIVVSSNEPIVEKSHFKKIFLGIEKWVPEQKVSDYHPAEIKWNDSCDTITLLFNKGETYSRYDGDGPFYYTSYCCILTLKNGDIYGMENSRLKGKGGNSLEIENEAKIKIENLNEYIAEKLVHPNQIEVDC